MQTARHIILVIALAALGLSVLPASGEPISPGVKTSESLPAKPNPTLPLWVLELAGDAQATLKQPKDGSLTITISAADATDYHIRLAQAPVSLIEGNIYTVHFRAKADHSREIKVYAQTDHSDFHTVGLDTPISLVDQWTNYNLTFKATRTEPNHVSCPQFLLGSENGSVYLADISLTAAPPKTVLTGKDLVSPATGLVWQFRNFDPGVGSLRQEGTAQVVTTTSTDGIGWHVQLNRLNSVLPQGQQVTVRFRAKAMTPTKMLVSGQVIGGDYHGIVKDEWEAVGTDWQDYSLVVIPHDIGGKPVLFPQFQLGSMPGTVWIDRVTTSADGPTKSGITPGADDRGSLPVTLPASLPKSGLATGLPGPGEIRLEGTIQETHFADSTFVLLVNRTVEPGGAEQDLTEPRPKKVRLSKITRFGTGSARLTNPGASLHAGDLVVVIGRNLGVGKVLPARQILTLP